ncbi:MAG: four helix bundle protein [Verrucomicrobiia bacterium]|jgi:four helix bundle protein
MENQKRDGRAVDPLAKYPFYVKACTLYEKVLDDSETLGRDYRSREIVRQLVRSSGSIPANIEEGYGRGTRNEFVYFLTVACGSARETRGWYQRSRRFLPATVIDERQAETDEIISLPVSTIRTLKNKSAPGK